LRNYILSDSSNKKCIQNDMMNDYEESSNCLSEKNSTETSTNYYNDETNREKSELCTHHDDEDYDKGWKKQT